MKITVVGAGAVGASCAEYIAIKNFASEVVIIDIKGLDANSIIKWI
jgi:malate dehydrogenase